MVLTIRNTFCLIAAILFSSYCFGKKLLSGTLIFKNGEEKQGFVGYRKIDVATRIVFYEKDSTTGELIKASKTLYGPLELKGFKYGITETWLSVAFTKKELGYNASYFLKLIDTAQNFALLGGLVTEEGCNCSGTKIRSSFHWILYNQITEEKLVLGKKRNTKIKETEGVAAFFIQYGVEAEPFEFVKPKDVLKPLKE